MGFNSGFKGLMIDTHCTDFQEIVTMILSGDLRLNKSINKGITNRKWSNSGGREIFRTCPDRPWGPRSLLYNGYGVFPGGKEWPGRDADPSTLLVPVHERVELYLHSRYGLYGLYRASVPVQGCILPLLYHYE